MALRAAPDVSLPPSLLLSSQAHLSRALRFVPFAATTLHLPSSVVLRAGSIIHHFFFFLISPFLKNKKTRQKEVHFFHGCSVAETGSKPSSSLHQHPAPALSMFQLQNAHLRLYRLFRASMLCDILVLEMKPSLPASGPPHRGLDLTILSFPQLLAVPLPPASSICLPCLSSWCGSHTTSSRKPSLMALLPPGGALFFFFSWLCEMSIFYYG